jgi:hypothetical protein
MVRLVRRRKGTYRLTVGADYLIVQISELDYRLVNDGGDPVLYEKDWFVVVDDRIPDGWVRDEYPDGEYFIGPPETESRGFWERWHDGDPEAKRVAADALAEIAHWHLVPDRAVSATPPGWVATRR